MFPRRAIPASVQDWFSVIIGIGHDRTIRLVLEFDGTLDHPRMSRALRLLMDAEPILGCRFVPRLFRACWRTREDLDSLEPCTLATAGEVTRELKAFMAQSIDPHHDPLIQIRIFRASTDTICIKLSHAAMDGGGFKALVERLTTLYRRLAVDASSMPAADPVTDRGQGQVLRILPLRTRWRAFFTQPFHKKSWSFPFTAARPADFTFSERTVDLPVSAMRQAAGRHDASVTDVIVTCFARALFDLTRAAPGTSIPSTLAMDLRRYLPPGTPAGLCNLSSLAWIDLLWKPEAPIEEMLAEVHRGLTAVMDDTPGVGLAMVMEIASVLGYGPFHFFNGIRAKMARAQGREFPSLSNIGMMDPRTLDFGDARLRQARFYSPVIFPPTFSLVSGSFEDTMYFTASYPRSVVPGELIEKLLDRIVVEIDSLR
jgi:NRPS condensation-like uncharacterized protein